MAAQKVCHKPGADGCLACRMNGVLSRELMRTLIRRFGTLRLANRSFDGVAAQFQKMIMTRQA